MMMMMKSVLFWSFLPTSIPFALPRTVFVCLFIVVSSFFILDCCFLDALDKAFLCWNKFEKNTFKSTMRVWKEKQKFERIIISKENNVSLFFLHWDRTDIRMIWSVTCSMSVSDMVFGLLKQTNLGLQRRIRRAFLANPEKLPNRIAIAMASVLLLSVVITYNVLFERKRREPGDCLFLFPRLGSWLDNLTFAGVQTTSVTEIFQRRTEKRKLEHLELQRNIMQAREASSSTKVNDLWSSVFVVPRMCFLEKRK